MKHVFEFDANYDLCEWRNDHFLNQFANAI